MTRRRLLGIPASNKLWGMPLWYQTVGFLVGGYAYGKEWFPNTLSSNFALLSLMMEKSLAM